MAQQPVYRGTASAAGSAVSSLVVTYASTISSLLVVAVSLNDGSKTVTDITDSAGLDSLGNPINQWRKINSEVLNGAGLELWACRPQVAITSFTVLLSGNQVIAAMVAEYTEVASYSISTAQQVSSGQNPSALVDIRLKVSQTPPQQAAIFVTVFGVVGPAWGATDSGTLRAKVDSTGSNSGVAIVDSSVTDAADQLSCTQRVAQLATGGNLSASNLQGIGLIVSSGLVLSTPPGFADLPDSVLEAEQPSLGVHVAKINDNAAFGMVRLEVFVGTYKHGEIVNLPQSPVDGYIYGRDELIYAWGIFTTANADTGWLSAKDSLWYCLWDVDPNSGEVTSREYYRRSVEDAGQESQDGILQVFTIAQRQKTALVMSAIPDWNALSAASFATDKPEGTTLMKRLNGNAKYGVSSTEVIEMGEFVNGDTVPLPVSPIDGYAYSRSELQYIFSWRWTCDGASFVQPPYNQGQLGPLNVSINALTGAVSIVVHMINDRGENQVTESGWGRIKVTALCQRGAIYGATVPVSGYVDSPPGGSAENDYKALVNSLIPTPIKPDDYVVMSGGSVGFAFTFIFTDDAHVQVGATVNFTGGTTLTVSIPAGATKFNQSNGAPYYGGVVVVRWSTVPVTIAPGSAELANNFAELSSDLFMPGQTLRASVVAQMQLNAAEAAASPEFFASAVFKNGDTVPLPVSQWDGYEYSRTEVTYFWEWSDTTPHMAGGTHNRTPLFYAHVDQDTGLVTIGVWRLPPGGPYVEPEVDGGRITVTVMGFRTAQRSSPALLAPAAPSDATTGVTDTNGGDTVNGV
jgi:hypothetical protein